MPPYRAYCAAPRLTALVYFWLEGALVILFLPFRLPESPFSFLWEVTKMRSAFAAFTFVLIGAATSKAQVSCDYYSAGDQVLENGTWSNSDNFQPGDTIYTSVSYFLSNTDTNQSYLVYAYAYCYDANGNQVAFGQGEITVPAASDNNNPGTANASVGVAYVVPTDNYTSLYYVEFKLVYGNGNIVDQPVAQFNTD